MAVGNTAVTQSYKTYDATSNREDLSNIIYNIDPFDTPHITAYGRRNVSNVLFEWQTESLPAVDTTADVEGFELERAASTATVRESNYAQIKHRDATITGTQEYANPAGKKSEMAHQIALVGKALKRDVESVLVGTVQTLNAGNATTARTTRPLINWLETNTVFETTGGGADPDYSANTAVTDGTQDAFVEADIETVMQSCYTNGAEPSIIFVGAFNKTVLSGFTGRANSRHMIAANKIVNAVSMYASDFGDLKILPSRWQRAREAFFIDPRYVKVAYYRNFMRQSMAKIGDAETDMLCVEFGLQVDNEAAHGVVRDLTTS
jgi:hypothetical protein